MKRTLFLLMVLFSVSCKNINSTAGQVKMPFEHAPYLYLPHGEDQSVLRQKLLNLKLTKMLNQKAETQILENDEFHFLNDEYDFSVNDKLEYDKYKASCAEIIVSYRDRLEIYFVPTGINRDKALIDIDVLADTGSVLSWVMETPAVLVKGQTYYLISSTVEEIKENDQHFFKQQFNSNKTSIQSYRFTNNQKVLLNFVIDYSVKETTFVVKTGKTGKCTRDMMEAGMCEDCNYKMEVETGRFLKRDWNKTDFEMSISLNEQVYPIEKFDLKFNNDKTLSVTIDLKKFVLAKDVTLHVYPIKISKISKTVSGFDFTHSCRGRNISAVLDLTPTVVMSYQMEVRGRVLNF